MVRFMMLAVVTIASLLLSRSLLQSRDAEQLSTRDRARLAALLGGAMLPDGVPGGDKGPCGSWKTCTEVYADNDSCGNFIWDQSSPCPQTRNCGAPTDKCSKDLAIKACHNQDATDCNVTAHLYECGDIREGKCNVSEIVLPNGQFRCTGGACFAVGSGGGTLKCTDWWSCQ